MGLEGLSEPRNLHQLHMVRLSLGAARRGSLKAKSEEKRQRRKVRNANLAQRSPDWAPLRERPGKALQPGNRRAKRGEPQGGHLRNVRVLSLSRRGREEGWRMVKRQPRPRERVRGSARRSQEADLCSRVGGRARCRAGTRPRPRAGGGGGGAAGRSKGGGGEAQWAAGLRDAPG